MDNEIELNRRALTHAKRIVVKVGTRVLVDKNGRPNRTRIARIAEQLAQLRKAGKEVVLVSSGAVGAGVQVLGMQRRPNSLPELQMAASVGQTKLLEIYSHCFSKTDCCISQVLLTHADLKHRGRHLNIRNTLLKLLSYQVIPIVNENDVVSVDEIRVGDNDVLSSLITSLIDADLLIILTTPDGLREPLKNNKTRRVKYLPLVTPKVYALVTKKTETLSTGGMSSKLEAAQIAAKIGAFVVIASGQKPDNITKILQGADVGTLIGNKIMAERLGKRKRWLRYFQRPQGRLIVDAGAENALQTQGKSLLPAGIKKVEGSFVAGSMVEIYNESNEMIAQGLVEYHSADIDKIKGKSSEDIEPLLGYKVKDVVIHRDNMVKVSHD